MIDFPRSKDNNETPSSLKFVMFSRKSGLCLCALTLCTLAWAGYRPLGTPTEWTFTRPTPATNPANGEKLGDFQPGIKVHVLESNLAQNTWLVEFRRYGTSPIRAQVAIPDLSVADENAYQRTRAVIDQFPLLRFQLETDDPWPEGLPPYAMRFFEDKPVLEDGTKENPRKVFSSNPEKDGVSWGYMPLKVSLDDTRQGGTRIIVEYWNKAESHKSTLDPRRAYTALRENLDLIENAFGTGQGMRARTEGGTGINALGDDAENFFLPNDIRATLRYRNGEYLLLELSSFSKYTPLSPEDFSPERLHERIRHNVGVSDDGEHFIEAIPMIDQGEKGYCAAAVIARVLNYYGYEADMHAVAKLAETEYFGTTRENILDSMRRICTSTPFRLKELREANYYTVKQKIDQGIPIVWLIPGHARLIIGYHPESSDIVYSDSWGPKYAFQTMTYEECLNLNRGMYILEP